MQKGRIFAIFLAMVMVFSAAILAAGECPVVFSVNPPSELIPGFMLQPGFITGPAEEMELAVEIPGLPSIDKLRIVYVKCFGGENPQHWQGTNVVWHMAEDYWPIGGFVAVKGNDSDFNTTSVYHEAYQVAFLRALCESGVNLPKILLKENGREGHFCIGKEVWAFTQVDAAIATVGTIRGAKVIGKPELIQKRFNSVLGMTGEDAVPYELERELIQKAGKNPDKYLELVRALMGQLVKDAPKTT
ncbi:MAG: hypothetical protein WC848_00070 [Parcubacteria group bacterium]|jgi:hypothetical protein